MAGKYANAQPQGYKNYVQNVAIVGAGGQSGKYMTKALLKNGKHNLTAITREGSSNEIPDGVAIKKVNYDDESTLVAALQGQDALIITMSVVSPRDQQAKLIRAAAAAGVPWILPNEWGINASNPQVEEDIGFRAPRKMARELIEELGKSSWVGVACGFWYEYSLCAGKNFFGFDLRDRKVMFYDDGAHKMRTSTLPQVGRAVANLLALKILPDDENDQSVTLSRYQNKFVNISSFNVNQQDMLDSVLRVTGTSRDDWEITSESSQKRFEEGKAGFANGDRMEFAKMLYARIFFPDAQNSDADNEPLGLPKEDLDEFTKLAVDMAMDHYIEKKFSSAYQEAAGSKKN